DNFISYVCSQMIEIPPINPVSLYLRVVDLHKAEKHIRSKYRAGNFSKVGVTILRHKSTFGSRVTDLSELAERRSHYPGILFFYHSEKRIKLFWRNNDVIIGYHNCFVARKGGAMFFKNFL